jgi:hypothetical protein
MANAFATTVLNADINNGINLVPGLRKASIKILCSNQYATTGQTITPATYDIDTVYAIVCGQATAGTDTGYVCQVAEPTVGVYPINLYWANTDGADSKLVIVPDGTVIGDGVYSEVTIYGI